ncbi:hypothetical protein NDU88_000768 [Pleurodeles waltl]|uniref:Uncharacterized protein n=1 Tax=Pleurodeles waltl TaxID=8319 RepID=A0AAV7V9C3_PLEWA|nr:hypothetical protein NDU88_000768 [Pleurodeles waltl]
MEVSGVPGYSSVATRPANLGAGGSTMYSMAADMQNYPRRWGLLGAPGIKCRGQKGSPPSKKEGTLQDNCFTLLDERLVLLFVDSASA